MPSDVKRAARVAPRLQRELAELLAHEVKDPGVRDVVVTRIEITDDLAFARVFFRLLQGGETERRQAAERGLARAAGMLRREVAQRMGLRVAPELRFRYDEGQDARARVEEILEEIRRDDAERE